MIFILKKDKIMSIKFYNKYKSNMKKKLKNNENNTTNNI